MSLVDLNPAGLNLASLKPAFAAQDEQAANQLQQQVAQVQLTNAQDEQQRNQAFRAQQKIVAQAPSVEAYTKLLAIAPREYVEGLKASIAQMDTASRKTLASQVLEPWLAGANGRSDLQKEKLEAQAAGFEARGMTEKAAGARDLIAKIDTDPDGVTAKLYATYVEAVGHEKAKAVLDSLGMTEDRLKKKADRRRAEAEADPKRTDAELREQLAKAKKAEFDAEAAKDAPALAAAQRKTAEIEARYKEQDTQATIDSKEASAYRDVNAGDVSELNAKQKRLTLNADVQKDLDAARREKALATVAEATATPDAIAAERELKKQQIEKYKAEVSQLKTVLGDLPVGVQENVRKDIDASTQAAAESARIRRVEANYRSLKASASTGTPARLKAWAREQLGSETKRDELYRMAESVLIQETVNAAQKIRPVSDTDMAILRGDKPKVTSNPEYVANYMGALARAKEAQAMASHDMAAWQTAFRGIGNAREDTTINGRPVKAGTSLVDFVRGRDNPYASMSVEELSAAIAARKAGKK